jgi:hypothetical protein
VYLLIRSAPILAQAPLASVALIAVGTVTAVMATLSGQVSADAKTGIAYATISQVALMVVECGFGFYRVATLHLVAHALLRYYQFLRAPSALQDALERRAALGLLASTQSAPRWRRLPVDLRRFLYRLAAERFEVEAALDRWGTRPVLALSRWLNTAEARLLATLTGETESPRVAAPPRPSDPAPTATPQGGGPAVPAGPGLH